MQLLSDDSSFLYGCYAFSSSSSYSSSSLDIFRHFYNIHKSLAIHKLDVYQTWRMYAILRIGTLILLLSEDVCDVLNLKETEFLSPMIPFEFFSGFV